MCECDAKRATVAMTSSELRERGVHREVMSECLTQHQEPTRAIHQCLLPRRSVDPPREPCPLQLLRQRSLSSAHDSCFDGEAFLKLGEALVLAVVTCLVGRTCMQRSKVFFRSVMQMNDHFIISFIILQARMHVRMCLEIPAGLSALPPTSLLG
jgi:hypothetical protein